jgi:C-terminal processing protease CtpA/Prc
VYDSNELEYILTVKEMAANIHDSHAYTICKNDSIWQNYRGKYIADYKISFVENKAVVIDDYNQKYQDDSGLKKGDVILKIKNQSVEDIVKKRLLHIPASNYPTALRYIAPHLLRSNDSLLNITFVRNGTAKNIILKCILFNPNSIQEKYVWHKDSCLKYLSTQICYLYPGTLKNDYFQTALPQILKQKGIIIDFRCYPIADLPSLFHNYFYPKGTECQKDTKASIIVPGLFEFNRFISLGRDNPDYYKGKVVIIVNEETQSYAESQVMCLQAIPNSIVIGSTTAGADGNVSKIELIGGISTYISGTGVYYPDGRETQRVGIIPDIEIHPTIQGIREGRDELLEKAIEIIK